METGIYKCMQDLDDLTLLREYAANHSEKAFEELVSRRVGFVYSAALRQVRDPHLAEEITQAVFIILAQKAGKISDQTILAGWLFKTTRFAAIAQTRDLAKRSWRRATIEMEVQMQTEIQSPPDPLWEKMSPLLDEALASLGETDRQAVLLRFFENKSLAEVGSELGTGEDTARKRVSRALEKLHRHFNKRGVSLTTAILAGAMTANSVQVAPVALAKSVTAVALAKGAAASGSTLTLIKGALKLMAWTKAKMAVAVGVGVLLAAGTATLTFKEIQKHRTYPWQVPKANSEVFYNMPAAVKLVPTKFKESGGFCCDESRGAMGIAQPVNEIIQIAFQKNRFRTVVATALPAQKFDFIAKLVGAREPHKNIPQNENWTIELQKEIEKQTGIAGKLEMRDADVMVLKPSSSGIRGFKVSHQMPNGQAMTPIIQSNPDGLKLGYSYHEQPVSTLASLLEQHLQIPIVDKTGLTNEYDYSIAWSQPFPASKQIGLELPNLEVLKQALHDQLGLELVPSREPIEMLVVEKVK